MQDCELLAPPTCHQCSHRHKQAARAEWAELQKRAEGTALYARCRRGATTPLGPSLHDLMNSEVLPGSLCSSPSWMRLCGSPTRGFKAS